MPSNKDPVSTVQPGSGAGPVSGPSVVVPVSTQAGRINTDSPGVWADGATVSGGALQGVLSSIIGILSSALGATKIGANPVGRPAWADGTTNVATTVGGTLLGIMQALTSVTGKYGAGKISVAPLVKWADEGSTSNTHGNLADALDKLVKDLTSVTGKYGAGKISVAPLVKWADEGTTSNTHGNLADALDKLVKDLTSVTGKYGAGKISVAPRLNWADNTPNPAGTVADALDNVVRHLVSEEGRRGAGKVTVPALTGARYGLPAAPLDTTLQSMVSSSERLHTQSKATVALTALVSGARATTVGVSGQVKGVAASPGGDIVVVHDGSGGVQRASQFMAYVNSVTVSGGLLNETSHDVMWNPGWSAFAALRQSKVHVSQGVLSTTWQTYTPTVSTSWGRLVVLPDNRMLALSSAGNHQLTSNLTGTGWTVSTVPASLSASTWVSVDLIARGSTLVTVGRDTVGGTANRAEAGYFSTNSGVSWQVIDMSAHFASSTEGFVQIVLTPDGSRFCARTNTNAIYTSADGQNWVLGVATLDFASGMLLSEGGPVLVALPTYSTGGIGYSTIDGLTWKPIAFKTHHTSGSPTRCQCITIHGTVQAWALAAGSDLFVYPFADCL